MNGEIKSDLAQPAPEVSSTDYAEMYRDAQPQVDSSEPSNEPVLARRFELDSPDAPEGTARERLHALRDAISTVQEQYPEVLGLPFLVRALRGG